VESLGQDAWPSGPETSASTSVIHSTPVVDLRAVEPRPDGRSAGGRPRDPFGRRIGPRVPDDWRRPPRAGPQHAPDLSKGRTGQSKPGNASPTETRSTKPVRRRRASTPAVPGPGCGVPVDGARTHSRSSGSIAITGQKTGPAAGTRRGGLPVPARPGRGTVGGAARGPELALGATRSPRSGNFGTARCTPNATRPKVVFPGTAPQAEMEEGEGLSGSPFSIFACDSRADETWFRALVDLVNLFASRKSSGSTEVSWMYRSAETPAHLHRFRGTSFRQLGCRLGEWPSRELVQLRPGVVVMSISAGPL